MKDRMKDVYPVSDPIVFAVAFCFREQRVIHQSVYFCPAVSAAPSSVTVHTNIDLCVSQSFRQISKRRRVGETVSSAQNKVIIGIDRRPSLCIAETSSGNIGFGNHPVKAFFQLFLFRHL